jgi:protein SOK2
MEQNYTHAPPSGPGAQAPMHPPHSSYPMPDAGPRSPYNNQPYTQHAQQLPYPQPSYDPNLNYGHPQSPPYNHHEGVQLPPLPPMSVLPVQQSYAPQAMDTTGQVQPAGMRPRLTTSVFEEEGSLCFQVDVNGICVARREGISPLLNRNQTNCI